MVGGAEAGCPPQPVPSRRPLRSTPAGGESTPGLGGSREPPRHFPPRGRSAKPGVDPRPADGAEDEVPDGASLIRPRTERAGDGRRFRGTWPCSAPRRRSPRRCPSRPPGWRSRRAPACREEGVSEAWLPTTGLRSPGASPSLSAMPGHPWHRQHVPSGELRPGRWGARCQPHSAQTVVPLSPLGLLEAAVLPARGERG